MAVPPGELVRRPGQRFVEMTKVAGIWPSGCQLFRNLRAAHLMATNCSQHAIRRVRHVTVVTLAAIRLGAMVRMSGQRSLVAEPLVTLRASPIVRAIPREHVVRIAVVQRVAR